MNLGSTPSVTQCQELCREYSLHVRDLKAGGKGPLAQLLTLIEARKHNILEGTLAESIFTKTREVVIIVLREEENSHS